jgi:hypothetical protein
MYVCMYVCMYMLCQISGSTNNTPKIHQKYTNNTQKIIALIPRILACCGRRKTVCQILLHYQEEF